MTAVTVYSAGRGCVRCMLTCRKLSEAGIPFRVVDLTTQTKSCAREHVTRDLGYSEAPVVIVDDEPDQHWAGFRPDLIDRLAAGISHTEGTSPDD